MMTLIEPIIKELLLGLLAVLSAAGLYFSTKQKGYNERQREELEEMHKSGQESKNDMEEIRSASDDDFINSVRDSER